MACSPRWACCVLAGCCLLVAAPAPADAPPFAQLAHTGRPLVQEGSGNLLPSPGFVDALEGWDTWGDVSVVEVDGEKCLRFGPPEGEETSRIRVYLREPRGGVLYLLRFEVKITPDVELEWEAGYPGLHGWLSDAVQGKNPPGSVRIRETRRSDQWFPREIRLFSHPETDALYVLMGAHVTRGDILTRRWEIIEEPVTEGEARVVMHTPAGDWAEVPHYPQPPAPAAPTLWAPADPDGLRKYAHPAPADFERPLELAGTPGEMCVASVALHAPAGLSAVKLSFGEPADDGVALGAAPTWKWIVFHPRRTDFYGRGRTFHYVPDSFVARPDGVDCPAGETTAFWINLRLPEDARPGTYRAELRARAVGLDLSLPVQVRVHPFELAGLPGRIRHLYLDGGRWQKMTDEQVLAEIGDVKDHGYASIPLSAGGEFTVQDGRVIGFELSEDARRMIRLAQEGGLDGPFGFWVGKWPRYLRDKLGLPEDALDGYANTWPGEIATAMVDALKHLKAEVTALGVEDAFIIAVDEPGYWKKGSPERYAWEMDVYRRAGWDSYCTTSTPPPDPLGMHVTYHCYGGGRLTLDPVRAAFVAEQTRAAGQQLWYYCTGAYSGQIGNMLRNRYWAGFFFYRCGAGGTASWTFQRPRGNAFDDFEVDERTGKPRAGQPCITYPDPEHPGESLDTPQWEGLRQACYDHRYAETLRQSIQVRRQRDPAAAERAEQRLAELMAELPWNGESFLWPEMTNAKLAATRTAIAEEIARLAAR